ncbi:hypothetical protein BSL78_03468 [Apostichopus japonicus]|uniref:STIL N-terminal domain-containing protein n=1 Tax=Stichopus japonicus TaxID=307972 RepID=A0A2G8LH89_STIJA|nr:hypothetical protein BSL78_03468 [Apostichopus japonicus]
MATEVVQNSAFFPFGNKGQEENKAPVTRTALISFPQTRQILWDSAKIGSGIKLHISSGRMVSVKISEKTIRLAYQHAAHDKGSQYHGFVVGNVDTDAGK